MIYAIIEQNGREQLCCVDKIGRRAFPIEEFFQRNLTELCIDSNRIAVIPAAMDDLIERYDVSWTDDMALFFGGCPELGIQLDPEQAWSPLVKPDEIWSPVEETRGWSLLE